METKQKPFGEVIEELECEIRSWQITAENKDKDIEQLNRELEAVGAGGVQPLRATQAVEAQAPAAVAVPNHVYTLRVNGRLHDYTPTLIAFDLSDGEHKLYTEQQVRDLLKALPATEDSSAGDQLQVEPSGPMSNDDVQDLVSLALREAWQLGQTYWQQADSVRITQQRKSVATHDKFQALIDETRAALATTQPPTADHIPEGKK